MQRATALQAVYSVKFSPLTNQITLAVLSAENYGIQGSGHLELVTFPGGGGAAAQPRRMGHWSWRDTLYDVAWNRENPRFLAVAAGDGCVLLVDTGGGGGVMASRRLHGAEVHSVEWVQGRNLLTAGWDGLVKLTDPEGRTLAELARHSGLVYQAKPRNQSGVSNEILTASGDSKLRVWDLRQAGGQQPIVSFNHTAEVLTCDWLVGSTNQVVGGDTASRLLVWDLRQAASPLHSLGHHQQAVRRVLSDPSRPMVIVSCGYDFSVREFHLSAASGGVQIGEHSQHHREFVYGLDTKVLPAGGGTLIADGSWDKTVCLYPATKLIT